jgi:hypothetical protein
VDFETGIRQIIRKINFTAAQPIKAVRRHDHPTCTGDDDLIPRLRIRHLHFVLPARTTAAADGETEACFWRTCSARKEFSELIGGFGGDANHISTRNLNAFRQI